MAKTKLELCSNTVGQASLTELAELAGQIGYGTISINSRLYRAARDGGLDDRDLRARVADAGVKIRYLDGLSTVFPGMPTEEHELARFRNFAGRDFTFAFQETLDTYLAIGEALGVRSINTCHLGGRPGTPREAMAEGLSKAAARAATHGFDLFLEFLPDTGMGNIATAAWLREQVGAPNVGIMLDTRHLARSGGGPADVLPHVQHVRAVQISDLSWKTRDDLNRLMPGDGDLPLAEIVGPVMAAFPDLPMGIEVIHSDLLQLPAAEVAEQAFAGLRALIANIEGFSRENDDGYSRSQ